MNINQPFLTGTSYGPSEDADVPASIHETQGGLSLAQITTIARAYRKQSALLALALIALFALGIKLLPKTYTATTTLIISTQSKDPLATPQFPTGALANYVATQTELITSAIIMLPVVDRLNLTHNRDYTAGFNGVGGADGLRDYVGKVLAKDVQVEAGRGGQLLFVTAPAKSAALAAQIANAVADVYLEEDRKRLNGPATERAQRYSQEIAELRAKAAAAQDKVTQFRIRNGMTDVTESAANAETQSLVTLQARLLDAQNQRRVLEAKQVGAQATADEALSSEQVGKLRERLSSLESQMASLSSTLGPRHPKVVALQSETEQTRAELNRAIGMLSDNTATQLGRISSLEANLLQAVNDQRAKVLKLHELQDEGEKLQVEFESAQSVYKRALDGYDQTLFASVDNSSNVSVIDRATPPTQPSKPQKLKLMLAGIFVSLLVGVAGPMAYELLLNRRIRCREDFERAFGIPVLAQFDAVPERPAA